MRINTRDMILVGLLASLTAIGAFVRFPIPGYPVDFTMQIFFVLLSGLLLGPRLGFLSQLIYLIIGLMGVPVFTKGGGIGYIFDPGFGYLLGFAFSSATIGWLSNKINLHHAKFLKKLFLLSFISALGLLVVYGIGTPYMYLILNLVLQKNITFSQVLWVGCVVFLPMDFLKVLLAASISLSIKDRIRYHHE